MRRHQTYLYRNWGGIEPVAEASRFFPTDTDKEEENWLRQEIKKALRKEDDDPFFTVRVFDDFACDIDTFPGGYMDVLRQEVQGEEVDE